MEQDTQDKQDQKNPENLVHRSWIEGLRQYSMLSDLRSSAFFSTHGNEIESLLTTPEVALHPSASPKLSSFLRVVQWNIEKGRHFQRVLESLRSHPVLQWADVILLNEADRGMNRSGNRHVARGLAQELGMHMVFGPTHLELTKGTGEDLSIPGEDVEGLQGNAILSRYPVVEARVIRLPVCFEPYHFREKRYGSRNCTWARLRIGKRDWWVGAVHLEVRDRPRCRSRQMRHVLASLPGGSEHPCLLGGDLNSNGFSRGTRWRTFASVWRLTAHSPRKVKNELLHPEVRKEPLFREAKAAGFGWEDLNSAEDTACARLDGLEDAAYLPAAARRLIERRLVPYDTYLFLKLDWLLARGVQGLRDGETSDDKVRIPSLSPGRVLQDRQGPEGVSDHLPIHADLRITR